MLIETIRNSFWMVAQQLFKYLSAFFVGIYIIRYLGPENFGILTFILTVVSLFHPLIFLGSSSILPREITRNGEVNYLPSFVKLSYLICIPLVLLISITIVSFDYLYANISLIPFSLLFLPRHIINYYNNSIHKSKKTTQAFLFSTTPFSAFLKINSHIYLRFSA